jgi:hypothetical protein
MGREEATPYLTMLKLVNTYDENERGRSRLEEENIRGPYS